jgi:hypothetical protein
MYLLCKEQPTIIDCISLSFCFFRASNTLLQATFTCMRHRSEYSPLGYLAGIIDEPEGDNPLGPLSEAMR